jgi:hypothetical protein
MRDGLERWRAWRRSRPFWGGLLLILAGLELLAIPSGGLVLKGAVKLSIYIGIGGVFGTLIAVLLIVSGLAIWFNQAHKTFYAIAGVLLGLASFPASNLGGFLIGMLLAVFGGAAAYGWLPAPTAPVASARVTPYPSAPIPVEFLRGAGPSPMGEQEQKAVPEPMPEPNPEPNVGRENGAALS